MVCALCGTRKARRNCPALHQSICPICCGTKRLTEIRCPGDCIHLAAAREHPPAVVRRQQERDAVILLPAIRHLTDRQQEVFLLISSVIVTYRSDDYDLVRLVDADVAEAAATLAATLETRTRGVIYEHSASSPAAQRLVREIQAALEHASEESAIRDGEAALVLRAVEEVVRRARAEGTSETGYMDLMRRVLQADGAAESPTESAPRRSSLIVPAT